MPEDSQFIGLPPKLPTHFTVVFKLFPESRSKKIGTSSRIIKNYYVSPALLQLTQRKLEGIAGISDHGQILITMLGRDDRDAVLIMKSSDVIWQNKLSKIQYNNPRYLLSDNAAAITRITGKTKQFGSAAQKYTTFSEIYDQLCYHLEAKIAVYGNTDKGHLYRILAKELKKRDNELDFKKFMKTVSFDGPEKITDTFLAYFKREYKKRVAYDLINQISRKEWIDLWINAALNLVARFKHEGEWVLKNKELQIPSGSTLYILKPRNYSELYAYFKDDMKKIETSGIESTPDRPDDEKFGSFKINGKWINRDILDEYFRFVRLKHTIHRLRIDSMYNVKYGLTMTELNIKQSELSQKSPLLHPFS